MTVAIASALYLAVGTALAVDTGRRIRGAVVDDHWLADLAGFLVIAVGWLPIMAWASLQGRR